MPIRRKAQLNALFFAFVFFTILSPAVLAAEESVTVTTYYPSPYGVYSEMRLYPKLESQATACDQNHEGLMFYDRVMHAMRVCRCINTSCVLTTDFTYSATNYWTLSGTNLYPNDLTWNVGIGTASPIRTLHVQRDTGIAGMNNGAVYARNNSPAGNNYGVEAETRGVGGTLNVGLFGAASGALSNYAIQVPASFPPAGAANYALRLDSAAQSYFAGNVGIGTTGPSAPLHIASSASGAIRIADGTQAAGRVLTSDANGVGTWQPPGGGGMSNVRVYTTSSTFTVPAGITKLWVEVYGGGGGGGGGCGGGGGAGGVAMGFVTVSPGQSIAVNVGAWGAGGCYGGNGGTSSFSALVASGGSGGSGLSSNWNAGGVGGFGSGGSVNYRGGPGATGIMFCASSSWCGNCVGGEGGYNTRGVGGSGTFTGQSDGGVFGGGGGGYPVTSCGGGYGGSGGVIIWY